MKWCSVDELRIESELYAIICYRARRVSKNSSIKQEEYDRFQDEQRCESEVKVLIVDVVAVVVDDGYAKLDSIKRKTVSYIAIILAIYQMSLHSAADINTAWPRARITQFHYVNMMIFLCAARSSRVSIRSIQVSLTVWCIRSFNSIQFW